MKRVAIVAVGLILGGCSWLAAHQPYFPTPDDVACVAKDVENGVTDPVVVVRDCPSLGNLIAADLEALIQGELQAKRARLASVPK